MKHLLILVLLSLTAPAIYAKVPVTDRHQDMTFTSYEVDDFADAAYRRIVAEQARAGLLDRDPTQLARVRAIAARLIAQATRLKYEANHWDWEIHITADREIDAFSMAGGKLLIGTHFINTYKLTDAELAAVLAHEIAHALAEHVREQLSEVQLRNPRFPYGSVEEASADMNSDISIYLSLMPLSELQEMEADRVGIHLVAMAGFPPSAALSFYEKLTNFEGPGQRQSLFATHASNEKRNRAAVHAVRNAKRLYQTAESTPVYDFH